jgi:TolB-like protein
MVMRMEIPGDIIPVRGLDPVFKNHIGVVEMRNQRLRTLMGGLLVFLLTVPSAWAGQVVTEREKTWARQALAQEAALGSSQMPDNTLSVLYFSNSTGQPAMDALSKGLAFMLMTDLSTIKGLTLVERVKLQALVEEMGLGASGLVDPGSAPRVGRLLGARFLVSGNLSGACRGKYRKPRAFHRAP